MAEDFQNNNSIPINVDELTRKLKDAERKLCEAKQKHLEAKQKRIEEEQKHLEAKRKRIEEEQKRIEAEQKYCEVERMRALRAFGVFPKLYLYIAEEGESNESRQAVNMYAEIGDRIRGDANAAKFIDTLLGEFESGGCTTFNAICAPSGTGKTQLAFALPRERFACLYMCCGNVSNHRQPIYKAFDGYMDRLTEWIRDDFATPDGFSARIYGFLFALIKLVTRHPELNLPADLSRLVISENPPNEDAQEIHRASEMDVIRAIIEWSSQNMKRRLVIFVDEFSPTSRLRQEHRAFLRGTLNQVHACCFIVASTNSSITDRVNSASDSSGARGHANIWAHLCTQLPRYVPSPQLRDAVDRCRNPTIQTIINLCLDSRPLFAATVADIIHAFLLENNSVEGLADLVDKMRYELIPVMRNRNPASSQDGCFGYIVAMLLTGGALISDDPSPTGVFDNFSTNNWAYLVNNLEILTLRTAARRAASDIAARRRTIEESERQRFESLRHLNSGIHGNLSLVCIIPYFYNVVRFPKGDARHDFFYTTFFPDPKEDFLFYLVLAGSSHDPGLIVVDGNGTPARISVAKLLQDALRNRSSLPASRNAFVPSFADHEAIVCAALYTACNAGSITGCSLEELITRFVAELMIPRNDARYQPLTVVDPIQWNGKFHAPFVFPFDTELPQEVYQAFQSAQASRPANAESVDAVVYVPDGSGKRIFNVYVVDKSSEETEIITKKITNALKNQDSNISFIVIDQSPDKDIGFDLEKLEALDRDAKEERQWRKGEYHDARIFSVYVDDSYKVVLRPIDGKNESGPLPDRLIFVINLAEINRT